MLGQQQIVGTSDWPDFEGDNSFTVPPKAMPELYTLMQDQVCLFFAFWSSSVVAFVGLPVAVLNK